MTRIFAGLFVLLSSSIFSAHARAELQVFLEIDGVAGEATAPGHVGAIDVVSWGWNISNPEELGRPTIGDLTIVKRIDLATPRLLLATVRGERFDTATLTVTQDAAAGPYEQYVVNMQDVFVAGVRPGGTVADANLLEQISLLAVVIEVCHQALSSTGVPTGLDCVSYDIRQL